MLLSFSGGMSLFLSSVNLLGSWKISQNLFYCRILPCSSEIVSGKICRKWKESSVTVSKTKLPVIRSSKSSEDSSTDEPEKLTENKEWPFLYPWSVPWDWKVTAFIMMPYLLSIFFTVYVESNGVNVVSQPHLGLVQPSHDVNEQAVRLFVDQLLKTGVKFSILFALTYPYRPFPDDIFHYRWNQPFNPQHGWLLWAGAGLLTASVLAFVVKTYMSSSSNGEINYQGEFLMHILPLIGASNVSTSCLLGVVGILAPFWEETLYRGFLMTTLTKWLPVCASILVSSAVFTLAHPSSGKSLEIFIYGTILGLIYSKTRNLLAPIAMHALWNMGVIFALLFLQLQGYEIQNYLT